MRRWKLKWEVGMRKVEKERRWEVGKLRRSEDEKGPGCREAGKLGSSKVEGGKKEVGKLRR